MGSSESAICSFYIGDKMGGKRAYCSDGGIGVVYISSRGLSYGKQWETLPPREALGAKGIRGSL